MSVNGFVAGPQGEMEWMEWNWDDELKNYTGLITEAMDCIVLGRKLAEGFIPYWASHPEQEGASYFNKTPKVVFTKTLRQSTWERTVLATGDLVEEINGLKKEQGKNIMVYGGATFVSDLIKNKLIDELHLYINPTAIPAGLPIFNELTSTQQFELIKASSFKCGIVVLHYKLK